MVALYTLVTVLAAAEEGFGQGETPDKGLGIGVILLTLLAVVVVIAAVWTFAARRGSRTPRRERHPPGRVGH